MVLRGADPQIISPAQVVSKFSLEDIGDGYSVHTLSMGRCDLLTSLDQVHNFGCRVALEATVFKQSTRAKPLKRPRETTHYRGSFWLTTKEVLEVDSEAFELSIEITPLDNLAEHCDVVLRKREQSFSEHEYDAYITEVIAQLRLCLRNPKPHICACDLDLEEILSKIELVGDDVGNLDLSADNNHEQLAHNGS